MLFKLLRWMRRDLFGTNLDGHAWCDLLGKPADDPGVQQLLRKLDSMAVRGSVSTAESIWFPQIGLSAELPDGRLKMIRFGSTRQVDPPIQPFPGKLPWGLRFGLTQKQVESQLGRSVGQFDPGFDPTEYFVPEGLHYSIVATYRKPTWELTDIRITTDRDFGG